MKNSNVQKFLNGGTLSVLCELTIRTYLLKMQPIVGPEVRMWSTTTIMKQYSTIAAPVTAVKQTSILEYGRSFVRIQYHQVATNKFAFELLHHPEIDKIWCSIDMQQRNDNIIYKWRGQLIGIKTICNDFSENFPDNNLNFILTTHFVALTPTDIVSSRTSVRPNNK